MNISRFCSASAATFVLLAGITLPGVGVVSAASVSTSPASTFLTGQVSFDGALLSTAQVSIEIWPKPTILASQHIGDEVATMILPVSRVDSKGRFSVSISPALIPVNYVQPDGSVNFDATISGRGRQITFSAYTTRKLTAAGSTQEWIWTGNNGRSADRVSADLGKASRVEVLGTTRSTKYGSTDLGGTASTWSSGTRAYRLPTEATGDFAVSRQIGHCGWLKKDTKNNQQEFWTYAYGSSRAKIDVQESSGSLHELGVATKIGSDGWTASGTSKLDVATGSGRSQGSIVDKTIYNRINLTEYQRKCAGQPTHQKWVATSTYALITDLLPVSHWQGMGCQKYSSGSYWKDTTTNVTWSNGLSIAGVIDVSSQAGWTSSTKMKWTFTGKTWLCGNSEGGPDQSWQVEAHNRI